jgi:hypothetical protein
MLDSLHHTNHIDAGETHYAQVMYHLQLLLWRNYNTVVIPITCKGKRKHTKKSVLLMQAEVVRACKAKFD